MAKLKVEARYGIAPHTILYSQQLSLRAKGLFTYMQSKPDGWEFSAERIALECSETRNTIQSAMRELVREGYLIREKLKNKDGRWKWVHILKHSPETKNPATVLPATVKPSTVFCANKQEGVSKKDLVRSTNRNRDVAVATSAQGVFSQEGAQVIKAFEQVSSRNKNYYANTTQRKACDTLIAEYGVHMVLQAIALLPKTNTEPYFPRIYTPHELLNKWEKLRDALVSRKKELIKPSRFMVGTA